MTRAEKERQQIMFNRLMGLGFSYDEINIMRRISLTLSRWGERECNGEIERDEKTGRVRYVDQNGKPWGHVPDRETGAIKRIKELLELHPGFSFYYQTDPRGVALYLIPAGHTDKRFIDCNYNLIGIAVY